MLKTNVLVSPERGGGADRRRRGALHNVRFERLALSCVVIFLLATLDFVASFFILPAIFA